MIRGYYWVMYTLVNLIYYSETKWWLNTMAVCRCFFQPWGLEFSPREPRPSLPRAWDRRAHISGSRTLTLLNWSSWQSPHTLRINRTKTENNSFLLEALRSDEFSIVLYIFIQFGSTLRKGLNILIIYCVYMAFIERTGGQYSSRGSRNLLMNACFFVTMEMPESKALVAYYLVFRIWLIVAKGLSRGIDRLVLSIYYWPYNVEVSWPSLIKKKINRDFFFSVNWKFHRKKSIWRLCVVVSLELLANYSRVRPYLGSI